MKVKCTDPHCLVLESDCKLLLWKGTLYYLKYFHMHISLSPPYSPIPQKRVSLEDSGTMMLILQVKELGQHILPKC